MTLRELFEQACDLPEAQREASLRAAGADDAQIAQVLAMIEADTTRMAAHVPLAQVAMRLASETELRPGDRLGVWKLIREIGHGGMGAVFLAERADGHFRQQAAIKLIRGVADDMAATRFAQERQLLASLQHPQIARLLDGGATPQGQPYLVMEYIVGEPIDVWCNSRNLGLRERLDLFRSICAVVQFAHQRLVAHCDLKPSNVLVREDGVPALLDFGIARVLDAEREGAPSQPSYPGSGESGGSSPMTPRYASPEQLSGQMPGLPTDIYALGLMLYELLAGEPPPRERGQTAPQPSCTSQNVAWRKDLEGDLDAIVARACAFDPAQRYVSVAEVAQDVARYERGEVVHAVAAPSRAYRVGKFVRRNKAGVAVAAVLALAILAGLVGTLWQASEAARRANEAEALATFQQAMLSDIDTAKMGIGLRQSQLDLLPEERRAALESAMVGINFTEVAGRALDENIFMRALESIDTQFARQPLLRAKLLQSVATTLMGLGRGARAEAPQLEALAIRRRELGPDHLDTLQSISETSTLRGILQGRLADSERLAREAWAGNVKVLGERHPDTLYAMVNVGNALVGQGKLDQAEPLFLQALESARRHLDHNIAPYAASSYAIFNFYRGDLPQAIAFQREAVAGNRRVHGDGHQHTWQSISSLAVFLYRNGELDEAERLQREALARQREIHGNLHPYTLETLGNFGALLRDLGKLEEAMAIGEEAAKAARVIASRDAISGANHLSQYARSLSLSGRHAQAEQIALEAHQWFVGAASAEHPRAQRNVGWLADNYEAWDAAAPGQGYAAKAAHWRASLPPATP